MSQGGKEKPGTGGKPPSPAGLPAQPGGTRPAGRPGQPVKPATPPPQAAAPQKPSSTAASGDRPAPAAKPVTGQAKPGSQPQLQIGSYRIAERVGAGGMGTVYRAIHVELDREVAIKVLPPEMNSNPTMVARFKREAKAAAQLQHDNIVQIYDVSEDKGRHFLALEFIRGKDLSDVIAEKNQLPLKQAIDILKQAARALDHAFHKGIVHRDIKPSNFLITPQGKVKLCDMGLALRTDAGEEARVTRDGTTVGTVDYMSPEQARDSRFADTRSDIYSLGCTLYQMLTGRVPYEGGSIPEKLFKHSQEPLPDPLQFNPEIPSQVLYVLNRMLEKKADDRYQTPKELLDDLDTIELEDGSKPGQAALKTLAIGVEADESATEELMLQRRGGKSSTKRVEEDRLRTAQQKKRMMIIGGSVAAGLLVVGFILWLATRSSGEHRVIAQVPPGDPAASSTKGGSVVPTPLPKPSPQANPETKPNPAVSGAGDKPEVGPTEKPEPQPPPIETTTTPVSLPPPGPKISAADREKLIQEFFPPIPPVQVPGSPVSLMRGFQQESGGVFGSLEAACRKAQSGSSKIQLEDNGPLFERSFSIQKANLDIRPKTIERLAQFRPTVAFDALADKSMKPYFLQAKNSYLYIEGIDFVLNASDLKEAIGLNPFAFFDIQGGDLHLKNCTFTVLGKHSQPVALVKFHGLRDADPARQPDRLARLVLEGCFARGEPLTAVTLSNPLAEVRIQDSLIVGGSTGSLFDITPAIDPVPRPQRTLRLIRSTLVTRGDFLAMDGTATSNMPTVPFDFKLLDSIVACAAQGSARKLLKLKAWPDLSGAIDKGNLDERSSLYTGWGENLIYSGVGGKIVAKNAEDWLKAWRLDAGDTQIRSDTWPTESMDDLSKVSASSFDPQEIAAGIQSRLGEASIGCAMDRLPGVPAMLHEKTFGKFGSPGLAALTRILPSTIYNPQKNPALGAWQGEQNRRRALPDEPKLGDELDPVLELTFNANAGGDLGKFIQEQKLQETTIVVVTGSGNHPMSPVRLPAKCSLVLWFQPTKSAPPLSFSPAPSSESPEALIEVREADLIIEGGSYLWPSTVLAGMPRRFIKVDHGNLTLSGCRLFGPLQGETGFEAISFTGGPQNSRHPDDAPISSAGVGQAGTPIHLDFHPAPHKRVSVCQLTDCVVGAESRCIRFAGSQGVLRLFNCVAVTAGTLVSFEELYEGGAQNFEATVSLESNTLAASKAFFDVGEWLAPGFPARPMSFSSRDNLFCDPFDVAVGAAARSRSCVLLRYAGRTLQQGILQWDSENDGFSYDLYSYVLPKDAPTGKRQKFEDVWLAVWGRPHVTAALVDSTRAEKIRLKATGVKLKDFERDKKIELFDLQQCEATKKASHGGAIGADLKRLGL